MLVSEFVQGFNNLKKPELQKDFCQKHLTKTYASIVQKNALLKRFVDGCVNVSDSGIQYIDMVANKMNFTWAIICLYTDLQLDEVEDTFADGSKQTRHDVIGLYDQFQQYGIIDVFCELIGEREINELVLVNKEALDTWHEEHSSTRAFISDLTEKAVRTFVEMAAVMKEAIPEEEKQGLTDSIKQLMGV